MYQRPRRVLSPLEAANRFDNYVRRDIVQPSPIVPSKVHDLPALSSSTTTSPSSSRNTSSHPLTPSTSGETSWFKDAAQIPPSPSDGSGDLSCQFDADDWFAQFHEDIDVSDDFPSQSDIEFAGDVPIFDAAGRSRAFRSLYTIGDAVGERQMIIFIRHFYCGACQAYIRELTKHINAQTYFTMAIPTSIIVIGCGSPELIGLYKAQTQCPFPIFADPSREIFKRLGMSLSANAGLRYKRPEYMKDISPPAWLFEQFRQMSRTKGMKKFKAGNWLQIGGEFLFQDGRVVWCHRMKHYRNHVEIETLKNILEIDR